jgi:hypothetical protein
VDTIKSILTKFFTNVWSWLSAILLGALGVVAQYIHGLSAPTGPDPLTALLLGGVLALIKKLVDSVVSHFAAKRTTARA